MTPPKPDFFGDLFNPAPKVKAPVRPPIPTAMKDYKGLRLALFANTEDYKYDNENVKSTLDDVAADEFVVDGDYGGGWGSFTMGILNIEDGMGKSFGVFGYSLAADS